MPTTIAKTGMTAEEFYDWANQPGNADRRWELEDGEPIEVPSPGVPHALVCWFVIKVLTEYVVRRRAGHILTNDCGLIVRRKPDSVRGPDVMLSLESLRLEHAPQGHLDGIPALVVEVVSPSDTEKETNRRVRQYLTRGVPLVWVVYPRTRLVNVCRPNEFHKTLDETDELTGNGVLPDFACPVRHLFEPPDLLPAEGTPAPAPKRPRKGPRK